VQTHRAIHLYAYEEVKRATPTGGVLSSLPGNRPSTNAKETDKRLKYTIELDNGQQDLLGNMVLTFNRRLTVFDSTKFGCMIPAITLSGYSFSLDSTKTKVTCNTNGKKTLPLRLLIAKDAVADSAAVTLTKADTLRFSTKKEADYGSIRLRFVNLDLSKNPVLQLVQGDKLIESVPLTQPDFQRKLFRPGTYDVRILYDINKNGKWDPGKFFGEKRQPETVYLEPKQVA
jgi:hypothetical protein